MKKDCDYTRRRLSRYLAGYLFAPQRRRIERHLAACPVCRSEFDAARRVDETQRIIRDITPAEGLARSAQAGTALLAALRRLLYQPLWLVLIVAAVASAYIYVINPILHDPDLERLDTPVFPAAAPASPVPRSAPSATHVAEPKKTILPAAPASAPLMITISVEKEKEKANMRQINDAMTGHPLLRTMRFSDSAREISGSLTATELYTFFSRIDGAGKVTYKRSRLAAAGEGELVPFVMRLQTVSAPPQPAGAPAGQPVDKPVEKPAERRPARTNGGPSPAASQRQ